jgi:hypothetical protein
VLLALPDLDLMVFLSLKDSIGVLITETDVGVGVGLMLLSETHPASSLPMQIGYRAPHIAPGG